MSYIRDDVSKKRRVGMVVTYFILILFAILAIAPLVWLAINSFKTSQDYQMNRLRQEAAKAREMGIPFENAERMIRDVYDK